MANILLVYLLNYSSSPSRLRCAIKTLSCTGAISFAISIVSLLPLRWILSLIEYYVYGEHASSIPIMYASEDKVENWRNNNLTTSRYPFIYGDRTRFGGEDELNNLAQFLTNIGISNAHILRNHVSKNILEISYRDGTSLLRIYFDRCFKSNAGFNCNEKLAALCNTDPVNISTVIDKPRRIHYLILDGEELLEKVDLMIDGVMVQIRRSTAAIAKKFQTLFGDHSTYFEVIGVDCKVDLQVTVYCETIPDIYILSN